MPARGSAGLCADRRAGLPIADSGNTAGVRVRTDPAVAITGAVSSGRGVGLDIETRGSPAAG